jgi:hypothetical protein
MELDDPWVEVGQSQNLMNSGPTIKSTSHMMLKRKILTSSAADDAIIIFKFNVNCFLCLRLKKCR